MIKYQIHTVPSDLELIASLPEEEQEYHGEYMETLEKFFLRSNMRALYLLPNFVFGGWVAPSGWAATFPSNASFKHYPFCTEKFDTFTMVRLHLDSSTLTQERLKDIQLREMLCLPRKNLTPPTLSSVKEGGWGAALEKRSGAFISILKTKINENDEVKEAFFVIAYSLLPDEYLDALQQREVQVQMEADEFVSSNGLRGTGTTFEKEFVSGQGIQTAAMEIGRELGKRIISDWSRIVGIKLQCNEVVFENKGVFDIPAEGPEPKTELLDQALKFLPEKSFIRPYSMIPDDCLPSDVPEKLKGYQIGRAIAHIQKYFPEDFKKLQETYKFLFTRDIVTFNPDCQTMIHGFRIKGTNQITWYNNCTPMNSPFLVFNGAELGFDCYNYNPVTGQAFSDDAHTNDYLDAFPVMPPFRPGKRDISKETLVKIASPTHGGWLKPTQQPKELSGTFTQIPSHQRSLFSPPGEVIHLEPVKVFFSGGGFASPVYKF